MAVVVVGTTRASSEATRKEESEAHKNNNIENEEYGEKHPQTNRPIVCSCVTEILFVFD